MWSLAIKLEGIYRTLVSPGFEKSLKCINDYLPLKIKKYPSGQKVFDWTIPESWTVREGYIDDMKGNRLIDFKNEPLFVGPYSIPFSEVINSEDLMKHLYSLPHLPEAIPICPSYYAKDWKLGVPHSLKQSLKDEQYYVHIDSEFKPGCLCIGEVFLPGISDKEIIVSTYMCHPVMANDNISGVVVAVELFKILSDMTDRYYSYRLIIIPETIGSITFLYHHREELQRIIGGYAITCCGDRGDITFKKSWTGDSLLDKAGIKALKDKGDDYKIIDFSLSGSDERQFNAPGFRIPMPTIMRTPPTDFPEYHSSFDNLNCITAENLVDTLKFILDTIFILEENKTYINKYSTEPFLSAYGIFKQVHTGKYGVFNNKKSGFDPGYLNQIVIHETNGKQDLLSIAEKWGCSFNDVKSCCEIFEKAGLIEQKISP